MAQTASLAVTSASVTIDPTSTDSYDIQGAFTGFSLSGAQYVTLSIGNFAAAIPVSSFVQQPGANVFVYQDATGQSPYWVSTLTLDLDGQTFEAQAAATVLAGVGNPFAFQLGTDQLSACSMARLQQVDTGSYQLTPADPVGMTCELSILPRSHPVTVPIGTATDVTITATPQSFGNGLPQNPQVFLADDNAEPVGDPICVMSKQPDGSYACTATINQASARFIPLVIQASVAGRMILSAGFGVQAVGAATDADQQQFDAIQAAMLQSAANFTQYGDTAYARILTLQSLRQLLAPDPTLTAQPIALCPDSLNIGVATPAGLTFTLMLNDLSDAIMAVNPDLALRRQLSHRRHAVPSALARASSVASGRSFASPQASQPLQCGMPQASAVWNNKVLIWDPGVLFFDQDPGMAIETAIKTSKCPRPQVSAIRGSDADSLSVRQFANYGTIIMSTHGGIDLFGNRNFENGVRAFLPYNIINEEGVACNVYGTQGTPAGCYYDVYPINPNVIPLHNNTILYMGFCRAHDWLTENNPPRWAPAGTNVVFYSFNDEVSVGDDIADGQTVFDQLLNQHQTTGVAYGMAKPPALPATFWLTGDQGLVYLANPRFTSKSGKASPVADRPGPRAIYIPPGTQVFNMNISDPPLDLEADLDGADGCQLDYQWSNTSHSGHLKPDSGGSDQDKFTDTDPNVLYTPVVPPPMVSSIAPYNGFDTIMANYTADPAEPPFAQACAYIQAAVPIVLFSALASTYDAGHGSIPVATDYSPPKAIGSSFSMQDAGTYKGFGASANVSVNNTGANQWTLSVSAGGSTPGANQGPYEGKVQLEVALMNPGAGAKIQIDGQFNNNAGCGSQPVCSFPDGIITITDSLGKLTNFSVIPSDHAPNPFTVMVDSSQSNTSPVDIYIGMNDNAQLNTPSTFTITLKVQFLSH